MTWFENITQFHQLQTQYISFTLSNIRRFLCNISDPLQENFLAIGCYFCHAQVKGQWYDVPMPKPNLLISSSVSSSSSVSLHDISDCDSASQMHRTIKCMNSRKIIRRQIVRGDVWFCTTECSTHWNILQNKPPRRRRTMTTMKMKRWQCRGGRQRKWEWRGGGGGGLGGQGDEEENKEDEDEKGGGCFYVHPKFKDSGVRMDKIYHLSNINDLQY